MIGTQLVNRRRRHHHRPSLIFDLFLAPISSVRVVFMIFAYTHTNGEIFADTCLFINWQTNPFYFIFVFIDLYI